MNDSLDVNDSLEVAREAVAGNGLTYARQAGISLSDTPSALYRLLVLTVLLANRAPADAAVGAARALFRAGLRTPGRWPAPAGRSAETCWAEGSRRRAELTASTSRQYRASPPHRLRETTVHTHDARRLATQLMRDHGLVGWRLVFDNAKTRAGICRYDRSEIGLSRVLTRLHGDDVVRDTVLHEIAHALVGPQHGHDATWKAVAASIGCSAERCLPPGEARPEAPWSGTCPSGHVVGRHRRPTQLVSCSRCARTFDPRCLFNWTYRGRRVPMHPDYVRQLEALSRLTRSPLDVGAAQLSLVPPPVRATARRVPLGAPVRVTAQGRFAGLVGVVEKVGRTRYHVSTRAGTLTVPFALVEPVRR